MPHFSCKGYTIYVSQRSSSIFVEAIAQSISKVQISSSTATIQEYKIFISEITQNNLVAENRDTKEILKSVESFYQYLHKLIEDYNTEGKDNVDNKIFKDKNFYLMKQMSFSEEKNKSKKDKQRLSLRVLLPRNEEEKEEDVKYQVKIEEDRLKQGYFQIKLNQQNLDGITFLRRFNQLNLQEMHLIKQQCQINSKEVQRLKKQFTMKIQEQNLQFKNLLDNFLSETMGKVNRKLKNVSCVNKNSNSKQGKSAVEETNSEKPIQTPQISDIPQIFSKLEQDEPINVQKTPIQFDQTSAAFHQFAISNKKVTKIGGFDYQPMLLKFQIPKQGRHSCKITLYKTKKSCLWFGMIEQKTKLLLHSSANHNYLVYRSNTCHVITNIQNEQTKKKQKTKPLITGEYIELEFDMDANKVTWNLSNGGIAVGQIPKAMQNMTLVPFVGIFTTQDSVEFEDFISSKKSKNAKK